VLVLHYPFGPCQPLQIRGTRFKVQRDEAGWFVEYDAGVPAQYIPYVPLYSQQTQWLQCGGFQGTRFATRKELLQELQRFHGDTPCPQYPVASAPLHKTPTGYVAPTIGAIITDQYATEGVSEGKRWRVHYDGCTHVVRMSTLRSITRYNGCPIC
jgi:hypothetical protein